jgi:hypothetical protein
MDSNYTITTILAKTNTEQQILETTYDAISVNASADMARLVIASK